MLIGYRLAPGATLHVGDCIDVMAAMPAKSVDAVVCDPPYGLEFMGKAWDAPWKAGAVIRDPATERGGFQDGNGGNPYSRSRIEYGFGGDSSRNFAAWCEAWAVEALRVLKPGGHLLAFGGTRTFHRLTCGIEDAGFEIRDCLSWLYGSGFPKSLDVSKAIDKAAGAERAVTREVVAGIAPGRHNAVGGPKPLVQVRDDPATDAAREWQGWGTALKPAWEPCVVARKPLAGTVAANVQAHGTGALNIDGCRIGTADTLGRTNNGRENYAPSSYTVAPSTRTTYDRSDVAGGRWPANVALDEQAAAMLDAQSGVQRDGVAVNRNRGDVKPQTVTNVPAGIPDKSDVGYGGSGGASRFFYVAKASKRDRGDGNTHPTVKPTALMRWLVRLVTPPGGIVLDPFAGSGTTLVACRAEGVRCIGIEREQEYAAIIARRMAEAEPDEPTLFDAA